MDGEELKRLTKEEMGRRIREGVKAVIEQVAGVGRRDDRAPGRGL